MLQELFYEAKVPISDGYSMLQKCSHTIEDYWHKYHTPEVSKVYNFVLAQETQKSSAIKLKMCSFYSKTDFMFLL